MRNRLKQFIGICLIVITMAGCASSPDSNSVLVLPRDEKLWPADSYELTLAPQGGEFSEWTAKLARGFCHARIRIRPDAVNPDEKWGSSIKIFISGKDLPKDVTVGAFYSEDQKAWKPFIDTGQAGEIETIVFDEHFETGQSLDVFLLKSDTSIDVTFGLFELIDGIQTGQTEGFEYYKVEVDFQPNSISLFASGADVTFKPIEIASSCDEFSIP